MRLEKQAASREGQASVELLVGEQTREGKFVRNKRIER